MNNSNTTSTMSLANASGKIPYNMTNDYMFRAVLQKNAKVLAGLVGSLLHLDPETLDVEIANPIILGESIDDKTFVLDVEVTVNKKTHLDLEMQVINYGNWKERALSYLCRSFDSLSTAEAVTTSIWRLRCISGLSTSPCLGTPLNSMPHTR